ncbi:MAG TPA: zf-HC2 domain-containing protein [Acidobacteriota bacterium]|nr:zf-HC2 domain-containing protein [Acidobacteriota bacterium]
MNCREFHRNLEDYLQGGLDFSGRFRLERHARECSHCGMELDDSQRLHNLASEIGRVKAPENFESAVLEKIAVSRRHGFLFHLSSFRFYGMSWPSWRSMMMISSVMVVLGAVVLFATGRLTLNPSPAITAVEYKTLSADKGSSQSFRGRNPGETGDGLKRELLLNRQLHGQNIDFLLVGPDTHPAPASLPDRIWMRYGQATEEYFIRNVSH